MRSQAGFKNEFEWFIKTKRKKILTTQINRKKQRSIGKKGRDKNFREWYSVKEDKKKLF